MPGLARNWVMFKVDGQNESRCTVIHKIGWSKRLEIDAKANGPFKWFLKPKTEQSNGESGRFYTIKLDGPNCIR